MIRYRQVDKTFFPLYDRIPMRVQVTAQYKVEKLRRGLGGFVLVETPVKPYVKDFTAGEGERAEQWEKRFDLSHWAFFMAFDGEHPVGAAAVASGPKGFRCLPAGTTWPCCGIFGWRMPAKGRGLVKSCSTWR